MQFIKAAEESIEEEAEVAAYAGKTGTAGKADRRTGGGDVSRIRENRLCGFPAKHKRKRRMKCGIGKSMILK